MKTQNYLACTLWVSIFVSQYAVAGVMTDAHGNEGYDTAAECDAAVNSGKAKFYQSYTRNRTWLRTGEKRVQTMNLKELGIPQDFAKSMNYAAQDYKLGACDIGVARKAGRDGVAKPLQGKYIPYSPDMPVNVYLDKSGQPVRASVKDCDNWFGAYLPRPVSKATVAMQAAPAVIAKTPPSPTAPAVTPVHPPMFKAPVVPAPFQAATAAAQGAFSSKEILGAIGFVAITGYLLTHNDDNGTTGTTGTTGTN